MSREFACSADNGAFQSLRQWFFIQAEGPRCVCVCGLPSRVVYLIVWLKLDTTLPLYLRRKKSIRVTTYDTHLFQMLLEYHI